MADQPSGSSPGAYFPEAQVEHKRRLSAVWVIPIVAVLIGAWLTYKSISERGPVVSITFRTADGLEAGKTKIRYRDVEIGVVEEITLAEDLSHVVVTAELEPGAERYLTDKTRFWVVRARVTAGRISGLGTLLSGAYIGIDPVTGGKEKKKFTGLEVQPVVTSSEAGTRYVLRSETMGSLEVGVPVYFRQVQVGEVVRTELSEDGEYVSVDVFVRAPHDKRVRQGTTFWNTSGFDATLNADGVRIDTDSFVSMLIGGVAFDTPEGYLGPVATVGATFPLYANKRATALKEYALKQRYLMHFSGSVRGLVAGAPVEFRGIRIGQVADVRLEYDAKEETLRIPVVVEIEPERIAIAGEENVDVGDRLVRLVDRGLRAQLKSGNLITGQLVVDLDFHPNAPPVEIQAGGLYPELPTVPASLEELTASLQSLLGKLESLPYDQIGVEITGSLRALRGTLDETEKIAKGVNGKVMPGVEGIVADVRKTLEGTQRTIDTARQTLSTAQSLVGPNSTLNTELGALLEELTQAARAVRLFAEHLERNPENLIRGRNSP